MTVLIGTVATNASASGSVAMSVDGPGSAEVRADWLAALPSDTNIIDQSKLIDALSQQQVDDVGKAILNASRHQALVGAVRKASAAIAADAVILGSVRAAKGKHPAEVVLMVVIASQDAAAVDQTVPLKKGAHRREQWKKILGPALDGLRGATASGAEPAAKATEGTAAPAPDEGSAKPEPKGPAEAGPEAAPERSDDTKGSPAKITDAMLIGFLALDFGSRQIHYNQRATPNLLPYDLPAGVLFPETPGVAAEIQAFPLSRSMPGIVRDIGLSGRFNTNIAKVQVGSGPGSVVGNTTWYAWELNVRGRLPLGERASAPFLGVEAGGGELAFSFPGSGATGFNSGNVSDSLPAVDYKYIRLGADGRIPVTPAIAVTAGVAYRVLLSAGKLEDHFPHESLGCIDARLGGAMRIANGFEARVGLSYVRVWATFNPRPLDTYAAGGAVDQFLNADLGVAAFF